MKVKRHTPEEKQEVLELAAKGTPVAEILGKFKISKNTYYAWKSKGKQARKGATPRDNSLQDENTKLKNIIVSQMLELQELRK